MNNLNNLDLILENIRLGHINALLLEATTEDEIVRGVNLINESMQLLASSLLQEGEVEDMLARNRAAAIAAARAKQGPSRIEIMQAASDQRASEAKAANDQRESEAKAAEDARSTRAALNGDKARRLSYGKSVMGLGAITGAALGADAGAIASNFDETPDLMNDAIQNTGEIVNQVESNPEAKQAVIAQFGPDYGNAIAREAAAEAGTPTVLRDLAIGAGLGAGAGTLLARRLRR